MLVRSASVIKSGSSLAERKRGAHEVRSVGETPRPAPRLTAPHACRLYLARGRLAIRADRFLAGRGGFRRAVENSGRRLEPSGDGKLRITEVVDQRSERVGAWSEGTREGMVVRRVR